MTLTCPRCSTNVPDDAQYCSYCNLPRPRAGFSALDVEENQQKKEAARESESPVASRTRDRLRTGHRWRRPQNPRQELRIPKLAGVALTVALAIGGYVYFAPLARSNEPEPKAVLAALEALRRMPSNEEGLSIDARLTKDLDTSRRMRNLVAYQGWTVKRIDGTKRKVLLIFSYDEVDHSHHQAEWLADLDHNKFTPQSDLAVSISK
jgi:hypothetical protein